jgi:HNH endonuclease
MVRGEPAGKTSGATATTTATATPSTPSSATATATAHDEEMPYKKKAIPRALREQVWLKTFGKVYEHKCHISWCRNKVTVFDFHMGHNIPESKGGETTITNLLPICSRCNLSMSDTYSISEWERFGYRRSRWWERLMCIGSP